MKKTIVKGRSHDKMGYTDLPGSCNGDVLAKDIKAQEYKQADCGKPKHVVLKARIKAASV